MAQKITLKVSRCFVSFIEDAEDIMKGKPVPTYRVVIHYREKDGITFVKINLKEKTHLTPEIVCTGKPEEVVLIGAYYDWSRIFDDTTKLEDLIELRQTNNFDSAGTWVEHVEVYDAEGNAVPNCGW